MNTPSFLSKRDYDALKATFRALLTKAGGPAHAAKEIVRVTQSRLSEYGAPHLSAYAPIDVVADLEAETGDPIVTRQLADLAGYVLVPKEHARAVGDYLKHLCAVSKAGAELTGALAEAIGDGQVSPAEARVLDEDAREVEQTAANLRADLRTDLQIVAGGRR